MKDIDNTPLVDFAGEGILIEAGQPLRPVDCILNNVRTLKTSFEQANSAYRLGVKLAQADREAETLQLEDAEYTLALEACKANGAGYYALILGQLSQRLG